jgi:type I restriction enzyme, S subunit
MVSERETTQTGGREATTGVIRGDYALSVGNPMSSTPTGWNWTRLTDVSRLETGHTPSRKHPEYWDGDTPWVGIRDATANHGRTIYDTNQHTNELGILNSSARLLPANTVCLSRTASVGYVVVMGCEMATSQDFVNWVCDPELLDYKFLKYILLSERRSFLRFSHGTTHQTIYFPEVKAFHVCLPDVTEQRAISQVLASLDDKIEVNRRTSRTLEEIARAIFKSWFVDFDPVRAKAEGRDSGLPKEIANLFPDSFQDSQLGEIPKGWNVGRIDDVAELNARTLGRSDELDTIDYIEISKVMRGEISEISRYKRGTEPSRAKRRLAHGDTVLSSVRPDRGAYFLSLEPPSTWIASTGFIVATPKNDSWAFLFAALTRPEVGDELGRLADGGAYPAIRPDVLGAQLLAIPHEQGAIDAFEHVARPLFERATHNRAVSTTLACLRDTLLPKLLTGEIRVPEAETLVEEAV